ncbi:hypothetical protein GCM10025787_50120 [Saccharopolyspora rosea]
MAVNQTKPAPAEPARLAKKFHAAWQKAAAMTNRTAAKPIEPSRGRAGARPPGSSRLLSRQMCGRFLPRPSVPLGPDLRASGCVVCDGEAEAEP